MTLTAPWLTAAFWLVGTTMQAIISLGELNRTATAAVATHATVEDLRTEVKWWRNPLSFAGHRRLVHKILKDSPRERRDWQRIQRQLFAWSILVVAALMGFIETVTP